MAWFSRPTGSRRSAEVNKDCNNSDSVQQATIKTEQKTTDSAEEMTNSAAAQPAVDAVVHKSTAVQVTSISAQHHSDDKDSKLLAGFIRSYLQPLIRLDQPLTHSDGLLRAAFVVYEIADIQERSPGLFANKLIEALRDSHPPLSQEFDYEDAWARVIARPSVLTKQEVEVIKKWLCENATQQNILSFPRKLQDSSNLQYCEKSSDDERFIRFKNELHSLVEKHHRTTLNANGLTPICNVSSFSSATSMPTPPDNETPAQQPVISEHSQIKGKLEQLKQIVCELEECARQTELSVAVRHSPELIDSTSETKPVTKPSETVISVSLTEKDWQTISEKVSSSRDRQYLKSVAVDMERLLADNRLIGMLFDSYRSNRDDKAVLVKSLSQDEVIWFIGDIHGDLLALEAALFHVFSETKGRKPWIVFLGDLFDRGQFGIEVVQRVFRLILEDPTRVCVLAGNHDEGLTEAKGEFSSTVDPSNFAELLNEGSLDSAERKLGGMVVRLFSYAPRALILPDGLLVVHGGFPHSDRWNDLRQKTLTLNSFECMQDFVWTRASERAKRKIPNRCSKGCQYGYEDFEGFCTIATQELGVPISRMVRGHDHVPFGHQLYLNYQKNPVQVINTMTNHAAEPGLNTMPCVGRWRLGKLPEVHQIDVPVHVFSEIYQNDTTINQPSGAKNIAEQPVKDQATIV